VRIVLGAEIRDQYRVDDDQATPLKTTSRVNGHRLHTHEVSFAVQAKVGRAIKRLLLLIVELMIARVWEQRG